MSDENQCRLLPDKISAITLFTEDLAGSRSFYTDKLGLAAVFEDDNSVVFQFGGTLVNFLALSEARS